MFLVQLQVEEIGNDIYPLRLAQTKKGFHFLDITPDKLQ